jgi:hypothetical protein
MTTSSEGKKELYLLSQEYYLLCLFFCLGFTFIFAFRWNWIVFLGGLGFDLRDDGEVGSFFWRGFIMIFFELGPILKFS